MTTPPVTRSPRRPLLVIAAVVVLAAAGLGLWYLFFRPSGPAPVSLGSTPSGTVAVGASAVAEASTDPSVDAESSGPASADPSMSAGGGDGIAGTWTIDPSVGSFDDFAGSFVGYRVREELASV